MRKAVLFEDFAYQCQFFNGENDKNNGYGCTNKGNEEAVRLCHLCPLGIEAEQEDLTNKEHPDAVKDEIDWDGLCSDGKVSESEILLVTTDEDQTEEAKEALYRYDAYMHRYDKAWFSEHK